jgi:hypothetical protein
MTLQSFNVLADLDRGISRRPSGSLRWIVKDVFTSSLGLEVEPRSKLPDKNFGPEVAHAFVRGIYQIEHEGTTPPFFSEYGLMRAQKLVRQIGRNGATGFRAQYFQDSAVLSIQSSANIEQLLGASHHAFGSVEGTLETISIHGGSKFIVYHHITRKGITCTVPSEMIEEAKDDLGRRVIVSGLVHYNAKAEPTRVEADKLRVLKKEFELPTTDSLTGSEPDLTDTLSTKQFIKDIRGG